MSSSQIDPSKKLPKYRKAPIVEVAASAQFLESTQFKSSDIASLWDSFGRDQYPLYSEQLPIIDSKTANEVVIGIPPSLQMARQWFMSANKTTLIQFQRDRLIYNWRKIEDGSDPACATYPHYKNVIDNFFSSYDSLKCFLKMHDYPTPSVSTLELGYVNFISLNEVGNLANLGAVFRDFSPIIPDRYLSEPKKLNLALQFEVPDTKAIALIQLATFQRIEDGSVVLRLELNVTGAPRSQENIELQEWFDSAHKWIVLSFDDLLNPALHTQWERFYA